ncbi:hypothetical protein FOG51_02903 [Hanseniaspora uvarum]|nr:hypothetical protein FOG51_02903 [Hanseniaspora uvarum]KAF0275808.1 hypothetical protein FOG50_03351 [Hanseniaspora uvarum]
MNIRKDLIQLIQVCSVFSGAFMAWNLLGLICNTSSPITVVISGSMEPAFQRGDILFLYNRKQKNEDLDLQIQNVGDIVVYNLDNREIPIVHRVINEYEIPSEKSKNGKKSKKSKQYLLTKGDNNNIHDVSLYGRGKKYLNTNRDILGTVKFYIPQLGYLTIWINENPKFQKVFYVGLILMSLFE